MAQRRMFSKEITNSSDFQMMSPSAQSLYFHIGMNSDDDGFCEVFTIMRMTESKPDDLRSLHERGLVYLIDSKIGIVKDWHTNNDIRVDRYTRSKYLDDSKYGDIYKTIMQEKIKHLTRYNDCISGGTTTCTTTGSPQVRLGKDSIEENTMSATADVFDQFWSIYPKKELKKKAKDIWLRKKLDMHIQQISTFIEKAKQTDRWKKGFIKQPPAFLNGECWNDDLESYKDKGNSQRLTITKY